MKDSKEYSKKIQTLYRSLKQKFPKPNKVSYDNPVNAIVFAIIAEYLPISETEAAMKRIEKGFVDFNDLRVCLTEELVEALGGDCPAARQIVANLPTALRSIFNTYHSIDLGDIKKTGKRPAKLALEKLEGVSDFVVDYCMLTALDSHAIPLTKEMMAYLKDNGYVHSDSDEQEIKGFLARQITARNGYEFYSLLRMESDLNPGKLEKTKEEAKTTKPAAKTKASAKKVKKVKTKTTVKKTVVKKTKKKVPSKTTKKTKKKTKSKK